MTNRTRTTCTLLLAGFIALALASCTSTPTENNNNTTQSPLVGTWIIMMQEGLDVSSLQFSFTFTETEMTYTGDEGCTTKLSYSAVGNQLSMTVTSDGCYGGPSGDRDTVSYSISGDELLMFPEDGDTMKLRKGTPHPAYLSGTWKVQTIDGQAVPAGAAISMMFTREQLTITRTGAGACVTGYIYYKDFPGYVSMTVLMDECSGRESGEIFDGTYTVTATSLTFVLDGTTYVAERQ